MKRKNYLFPTLFILLASLLPSFAQTNSVVLLDGSGTQINTYPSIGNAFAAIPGTITQSYVIELNSSYNGSQEIYPINLTPKAGASSSNTITLRPEASVTSLDITSVQTGAALISLADIDYFIIDGRPGGTGTTRALHISNQGTNTTSYGVEFRNGACNNIIRYCRFSGYTTSGSGGKAIVIGASTNPTGNSDNRLEFLTFDNGPRYYINCVGTGANPNRNTVVFGCEFLNINFCGWWQQAGTGKTTVDSCMFYATGPAGSSGTGTFAILSDFQTDTLIITRNKIFNMDNSSYTTDAIGIALRSFNTGSVVRIFNNFISMTAPNSTTDELFGIEFGTNNANNPFDAQVYHNTVLIGGSATGGTIGNVNSAALSIANSDSLAKLDVRNNIFINERSGGNEQHLAVSRISTLGSNIFNYNTYQSTGTDFARIGTTVYPDFSSYQTAAAGQEIQSNSTNVNFVSQTDLHLSGASIADPLLWGISLAEVPLDIDGDPRVRPYRGADEADEIVGIKENIFDRDIHVYPQPASDYVIIQQDSHSIQHLDLYNAAGSCVASLRDINSTTLRLDTRSLAPGIYFLRVFDVNGGSGFPLLIGKE